MAMEEIEALRQRARQWVVEAFGGPPRGEKLREIEAETVQRQQDESDRHERFLIELRETIRDYWRAEGKLPDDDEPSVEE